MKTSRFILFYILLFASFFLSPVVASEDQSATENNQQNWQKAVQLMSQGEYQQAVPVLDSLLANKTEIKVLLQRSQAYRFLGFQKKSLADLLLANDLLSPDGLSANEGQKTQAVVLVSLAQAYFQNQLYAKSLASTEQAIELSLILKRNDLLAIAYNLKANLLKSTDIEQAMNLYQDAYRSAKKIADPRLMANILINLAALHNEEQSLTYLYQARDLLKQISRPIAKVKLRIAIASRAIDKQFNKLAYNQLIVSLTELKLLNQERLLSESYGLLGNLYERQQIITTALDYTQQAIQAAQRVKADDLLIKWEWQQGRLQKQTQSIAAAIASYQRAVNHIQAIRKDIPVLYENGQSSFRQTLAPIYLDLVELLFTYSENKSEQDQQQILSDALQIVERLKTAEMQDYFKDACAVEQSPLDDLNKIAPGSAVIYPIIFADHLDLLVQIGAKKYHLRIQEELRRVKRLVYRINASIRPRPGGFFRRYSKRFSNELYDVLIKPLETKLQQQKIHTLVYASDGFLRQLPLGALWTGKNYLIEDYALVNIPGLTLMEMKSAQRQKINALVAGISRPGDVVESLPVQMQQILALNGNSQQLTRGIRLRALPDNKIDTKVAKLSLPLDASVKDKIQSALQLPGVIEEIEEISNIIPTQKLLNKDFTLINFEKEIASSYNIVHIASHGLFAGTPENSFLIAYDKVLNMNQLEDFFKSEAFSSSPVEILTLSACQTAEGDDRSPLGLSGVALKSGARSALGSLWPVADVVAKQLLPDFYHNLTDKTLTKAQALQKAKIKLLKQKKYSHPGLWAAFILIGNWL